MAYLKGALLTAQDLYTSVAIAKGPVGELLPGSKGRLYRYVLAGASDLVAGNLLQESVEDTQFENMAVGVAGVLGDQFISVTNGTTTVTSAAFQGGTITIYTAGTSLIGEEYEIKKVTGTLTSGGAMQVYLDRPLRAAITTAATVNMKRSPWSGVIQQPATTQTGMTVGVAIFPIKAGQYGWVLSHGEATVLSDGSTFAVSSEIGNKSGTAGAATVYAVGTTRQKVGVVRQAAASGKGITAFIQID